MKGTIAAFVVIDLPRAVTLHAKAGRKLNQTSKNVQNLLQSECKLIGITKLNSRFQLCLQYASVLDCLRAIGAFARSSQGSATQNPSSHIGVSVGELRDESLDADFHAIRRAQWLTTLTTQPSILLDESAAAIAQEQELIPYAVDEFGEFFNIQRGISQRVFSLAHPQLLPLTRVEDDQPKHNIPWLTEFFIGREADIETVGSMLEHSRYVRLIGHSGVGKSTLAKRIGLELADQYQDGVKYVDLSQVVDRASLLTQVLKSFEPITRKEAHLSLDVARRHLGGRHHLIILDGGDNVETHVEALVNSLLQTRRVQILSTSINTNPSMYGVEYLVEDMPVPYFEGVPTIRDIESIDSCAVFLDAMRKYRQGLPPQESETLAILDICRKTGGSPLALSLTAKRLRFESLDAIISSYESARPSPALQSAVMRTVSQLPPSCRQLIESASAFHGPWKRNTLATLLDKSPRTISSDLAHLMALGIVKSVDNDSRYALASHFRDGVRSDLKEKGDLEESRERHLLTILALFQKSIHSLNGPDQRRHLDSLHEISDDLRAALTFLIESRATVAEFIEAMRALWPYWYKRNRLRTVLDLSDAALAVCGPDQSDNAQRLRMLKAIFLTKFGHASRSIDLLNGILEDLGTAGDKVFTGQLLVNLGIAFWAEGRYQDSLESHSRASEIALGIGRPEILLGSYGGAASACICLGQFEEANQWQALVRPLAHASDDPIDKWNTRMGDAQIEWGQRKYQQALESLDYCLSSANEIGDSSLTSRTFLWKAQVHVSIEDFEAAAMSLGSCIATMDSDEHSLYRTNLLRIQHIEQAISEAKGNTFLNQFKLAGTLGI